jgi:hypothetical protein
VRLHRIAALCVAAACSSSGKTAAPTETPARPVPEVPVPPPAPAPAPVVIARTPRIAPRPGVSETALAAKELRGLRVGMRVVLSKRIGQFQPKETGHTASVAIGPGQRGEIVRFVHVRNSKYDLEYDAVVVRWDPQIWFEWDIPLNRMQVGKEYSAEDLNRMNRENGNPVSLPRFESGAAWDALVPEVGDPRAFREARNKQHRAKPRRVTCAPPLRKVEGRYIAYVRDGEDVQAIVGDLAKKIGITIRRVWPALLSFSADMTPAQLEKVLLDERLASVSDDCIG